ELANYLTQTMANPFVFNLDSKDIKSHLVLFGKYKEDIAKLYPPIYLENALNSIGMALYNVLLCCQFIDTEISKRDDAQVQAPGVKDLHANLISACQNYR